jgi:hypothetical protein
VVQEVGGSRPLFHPEKTRDDVKLSLFFWDFLALIQLQKQTYFFRKL